MFRANALLSGTVSGNLMDVTAAYRAWDALLRTEAVPLALIWNAAPPVLFQNISGTIEGVHRRSMLELNTVYPGGGPMV